MQMLLGSNKVGHCMTKSAKSLQLNHYSNLFGQRFQISTSVQLEKRIQFR